MADGINATLPANVLPATEPGEPNAKAASQPPVPAISDQVTLSTGAQAQQLEQSGRTISQIAAALGIDAATVDSYLGISSSTSTTPAAINPTIAKAAVDGAKLG